MYVNLISSFKKKKILSPGNSKTGKSERSTKACCFRLHQINGRHVFVFFQGGLFWLQIFRNGVQQRLCFSQEKNA